MVHHSLHGTGIGVLKQINLKTEKKKVITNVDHSDKKHLKKIN